MKVSELIELLKKEDPDAKKPSPLYRNLRVKYEGTNFRGIQWEVYPNF